MRLDTALNKQRDGLGALKSLYSTARICGMESSEINTRFNSILANTGDSPRWVRAYLEGFRDALTAELYANCLAFGGYYGGAFYSVHSKRADYYGKAGIAPADWADAGRVSRRGHYWITTEKPRPFFVTLADNTSTGDSENDK